MFVLVLGLLLALNCTAQVSGSQTPLRGGKLFSGLDSSERLMMLTPYASITGVYDLSNNSSQTTVPGAFLNDYTASGITARAGLDGYRVWRNSVLGVSLVGSFQRNFNSQLSDRNTEFLSLGFQHQPTRRVTLEFTEIGGSSNNALSTSAFGMSSTSLLPGLGSIDRSLGSLPTNDLSDDRVYFSSTAGMVTYQRTARQSFFGGGSGFIVHRKSPTAPGVNGGSGNAGMGYRISRRQTISLQYVFVQYNYTRRFGNANSHMAGVGYQVDLSPRWKLNLMGGAYRMHTVQAIQIALAPDLADLLGQTTSLEVHRGSSYFGAGSIQLTGDLGRNSTVNAGYYRTTVAGNDVFLSSRLDVATGNYSYRFGSRCNVNLTSMCRRQTAFYGYSRPMEQIIGTSSFTYRISRPFYLTASVTGRHTMFDSPTVRPNAVLAMVGFGFTPSSGLPLF